MKLRGLLASEFHIMVMLGVYHDTTKLAGNGGCNLRLTFFTFNLDSSEAVSTPQILMVTITVYLRGIFLDQNKNHVHKILDHRSSLISSPFDS